MAALRFKGSIVLAAAFFLIQARAVQAQTPEKSSITPEQMLEEALNRYDAGDYQEANAYLEKVKTVKPDLNKVKLVEGLLFLERRPKGNWTAQAVGRLTDYNSTTDGGNDYRGNAALGKVYKDSRMYGLAIRPLEKAKGLAPPDVAGKPIRAMVAMDLAECYLGQKKDKKALETAKEAEAAAPNDPSVLLDLARIAFNTKDYDTSVKSADRAMGLINAKLRTSPFKSEDIKNLEECVDLKLKVFNTKITDNSKDAQGYNDLAITLREKADVERRMQLMRAREIGLKGIANDPKMYKLQVFIAGIEAELGGTQDAIDRLNDTINNDPNNEAAVRLRTEIQARAAAAPR